MKKNILIVIGGLIILWIGLGYGYFLGQKQTEVRPLDNTISLLRSPLIKDWRTSVVGKIAEVTSQAITISSGDQTLTFFISEETKVKKVIIREEQLAETIEGLTLQDIQKNDTVSIGVIADLQGNLQADVINIQEIR